MPPPQKVIVTYSGPLAFLQSDHWKQVHAALAAQLPLRTLHWRSAARPSVKTIQVLDVDLVPLDEVKYESTSQVPQSVLGRPLLNLYVFVCEDADVYRNSMRKQMKEWHSLVSERKNQEYLIVHVTRPDTRVASGGIFRSTTSVIDKVRADFNTEKRERCVVLAWSLETAHPAAWADLVNKIKENVLVAFDTAITAREEEVRRSEGQRTMPGWNFCTFFVLKESLASSFEGVKLHDEALTQYNSLESSFFAVLQEKSLSWFGTLAPDASSLAAETSLPLLSVDKKAYRDLILANTISVFDFRVYLLAQQCNLLGKMGQVVQVAKKVTTFLGAFGRRLREVSDKLPPYFIESWSYASALSVVEQCDIWAAEADLDSAAVAGFNTSKAELLEHARKQLDIIGVRFGHLPARLPFSSPDLEKSEPGEGAEPELLKPLRDSGAFYDLYIAITTRAVDLYVKAGRKKFAYRLHGDVAAVDMQRGRFQQAAQTYSSLPAHYAHYHWAALESFMHGMALDLRTSPDSKKNKEWMQTALALVKLHVDGGAGNVPDGREDRIPGVVQGIIDASDGLDDVLTMEEFPAFKVSIKQTQTSIMADEDGSQLEVNVQNLLPCSVTLSEMVVTLSGRNTDQLTFASKSVVLQPGPTSTKLHCPSPSSGTFIFASSILRAGKLIFQYTHQKTLSAKSKLHSDTPVLVHIPKDSRALDVQLHQPGRIELGASSNIVLTLSTGRNDVTKASIKLKGPGSIAFRHSQASAESNEFTMETSDDAVTFKDMGKDKSVSILVPHTNASSFQSIEVNIFVEYSMVTQPNVTRSLTLTREVVTSLPLQVNVQDFFRGKMLFSRFTISTTSQLYIRVDSAELAVDSAETDPDASGGVEVTATGMRPSGGIVVTPAHPANFLFRITSEHGPVRDTLRLRVKYCTLQDETTNLIRQACARLVGETAEAAHKIEQAASELITRLEARSDWSERYRMTGDLDLFAISDTNDAAKEIVSRISTQDETPWRELLLPVDIPQMNILSAVRVRLVPPKTSSKHSFLYAGQPISAELTIQTSFHWGSGRSGEGKSHRLRFDVEEMVREWLVSGRKRGDFVATDGGTYTVPLTLIALNHGELALPKVFVTPFPLAGEMTMGSMALPSSETHQLHGAEKVLILPRGGRTTFVVGMGEHYH